MSVHGGGIMNDKKRKLIFNQEHLPLKKGCVDNKDILGIKNVAKRKNITIKRSTLHDSMVRVDIDKEAYISPCKTHYEKAHNASSGRTCGAKLRDVLSDKACGTKLHNISPDDSSDKLICKQNSLFKKRFGKTDGKSYKTNSNIHGKPSIKRKKSSKLERVNKPPRR